MRIVAPTDEGYAVINEEDFVEGKHVLFVDPPSEDADEESEEKEPTTVDEVLDTVAAKRKPRRVTKPQDK